MSKVLPVVLCAFALAGCSAVPLSTPDPSVTFGYEPSTIGWDEDFITGTYVVSDELAPLCEYEVWASGVEILDYIPLDALPDLDAVACAFGPPPSGDPESALEVVFHIDDGAADLLAAFTESGRMGSGSGSDQICMLDSMEATPLLVAEFEGRGYLLGPGPDWCFADHPEWQAMVDQITVSVVAADEVHSSEAEF